MAIYSTRLQHMENRLTAGKPTTQAWKKKMLIKWASCTALRAWLKSQIRHSAIETSLEKKPVIGLKITKQKSKNKQTKKQSLCGHLISSCTQQQSCTCSTKTEERGVQKQKQKKGIVPSEILIKTQTITFMEAEEVCSCHRNPNLATNSKIYYSSTNTLLWNLGLAKNSPIQQPSIAAPN